VWQFGRGGDRRAGIGMATFFAAVAGTTVSTVSPEAERLLESEPLMAHLGTCAEGRPHVAPVWYRYADGVVEIVTTGRKLANIRRIRGSPSRYRATRRAHAMDGLATRHGDGRRRRKQTAAARRRINEKYDAESDAYAENTLVRIEVGSATYQTY